MVIVVQVLSAAKHPMIVLGSGALQRADSSALLSAARRLADSVQTSSGAGADWNVFNVLHRVCLVLE
jgi:NADH-quinone oxidoreductase subunit G